MKVEGHQLSHTKFHYLIVAVKQCSLTSQRFASQIHSRRDTVTLLPFDKCVALGSMGIKRRSIVLRQWNSLLDLPGVIWI